jgi:hypothetical protein
VILPAFVAAGALAANATTVTLDCVAPACNIGDILICAINSKDNLDVTPPDGTWTPMREDNNTANQRVSLFWKRAVAGSSGATFSFTKSSDNNILFCGVISAWRNCPATGSPIVGGDTGGTASPNASADAVTYATYTPGVACHLVAIGFYNDDATTAGTISGTDPALSNRWDLETATGSDSSIFGYSGDSTGAATGARSHSTTSTTDAVNVGVLFGLLGTPEPIDNQSSDEAPKTIRQRLAKPTTAAIGMSLAFVPLISHGVGDAASANTGLSAQTRPAIVRQYEPTTGPVRVPVGETPFVAPVYPDRQRPLLRLKLSEIAGAIDQSINTGPATSGSTGATAQTRAATVRQYEALTGPVRVSAPVAPELVTPIYPDRVTRVRGRIAESATVFDPLELTSFLPSVYPDRVRRAVRSGQDSESIGPLYISDVTDPSPALSWSPDAPERTKSALRARVLPSLTAPFEQPVAPPEEGDATSSQSGLMAQRRAGEVRQYAPVTGPVRVPSAAVAPDLPFANGTGINRPNVSRFYQPETSPVFIDVSIEWQPIAPQRRRKADRRLIQPATVAPLYLADITDPAPALGWDPTYPDKTRRAVAVRTSQHLGFAWHPVTPAPETVPDFFAVVYPDRTRRAPRGQALTHVEPVYIADVTDPAPALSWEAIYPDLTRKPLAVRLSQHQAVAWYVVTPGEEPAPEFLAPVYPDIARTAPRGQPLLYVDPIYVPDVTDPAPILSWAPVYPDKVTFIRLGPWLHLAWAKNLQPVIVEFEPGQRTSLTMVRTSRRLTSAMVREITAALTRQLSMDEDE